MTAIAAVDGHGENNVLVLHGWALDSSVWLAARVLSDITDFTFAYVDFPGYGVNANTASVGSLREMAQVAIEAADELGWQQFSLLGHSMGGATALLVASLVPDRVVSVAAVTPVSPAGTPLDAQTYAAFAGAWADPGTAIQGALAPKIDPADLARLVARNRATMRQEVWEKYLANWSASPSFMSQLGNYRGPVTLFWGETDPFVTPEYLADTAAALRAGHTEQLVGAGHYPMVESPESSVPQWEAALRKR